MTTKQIAGPRDCVIVDFMGKQRPMIVLEIDGEIAICINCHGTLREGLPGLCVKKNSAEANSLGFYKDTYIYFSEIVANHISALLSTKSRCPPGLFLKITSGIDTHKQNAVKYALGSHAGEETSPSAAAVSTAGPFVPSSK